MVAYLPKWNRIGELAEMLTLLGLTVLEPSYRWMICLISCKGGSDSGDAAD